MDDPTTVERWTLGRMQHPMRGFLHGSAAVVAVAGAVWLMISSPSGLNRNLALAIFGVALVSLFTVSTLYHTIPWQPHWKSRMERIDHGMISVFVAASYTPLALIIFEGWLTWVTLSAAWSIAAAGVIQLAFFPRPTTGFSIVLDMILGWLGLLLLVPIANRLPWTAIALMLGGGIAYTLGMVLVVTERPRLWPRVFSYHEAFHLLVIAGSALHFAVMIGWVAGFTPA